MERRTYRIGIDVGGTFTKAVLIDNSNFDVVGRYSVLTTHRHERGVAQGVIEVFQHVLQQSGVAPADVVFIAHSTTQATNALLEGDVAAVGIVGIAGRIEALLARGQTNVKDIELAPGRFLRPSHRFITHEALTEETLRIAIEELRAEGIRVVVASGAFGVDDQDAEEQVRRAAIRAGLAVTCGHEVSKLYGLSTRTRTAVINASILPKMIATANMTEASVREAGITAPLMIMRGDGGVMNIEEMRSRPVMTMLSGPAASVAGALMHLKVSDGIYFEVGGTSTNIGVIRNGKPTVKYAKVGGHDTYVNSLDVRVIGIAGGSMVRVGNGEIVDVGPRSAHIAGLAYAAFANPEFMQKPVAELFKPGAGDPADYLAIRVADGTRYAITTTCAANALGYPTPGMHAHGNTEAARKAIGALASHIGLSIDDAARRILDLAAAKAITIVDNLVTEYALDRDQVELVGEGGGAGALIPYVAEKMQLAYRISPDAEVISSIGVALALVREVVERVIPNPRPEDLQAIKREAFDAAVRLGAVPDQVEVTVEVFAQTQRVRATATGASEMRAQDRLKQISDSAAHMLAARSMNLSSDAVELVVATDSVRIFQGTITEKKWRFFNSTRRPVRALDREGVIRIQRSDGVARIARAGDGLAALKTLWEEVTIYNGDSVIVPDIFMIAGAHIVDLSGMQSLEQATAVSQAELQGLAIDTPIALIGSRRTQ
jgi:N-methylhydantoinase A/oxoprolinase/acetone carboxylase beta subunit